MGSPLKARLDGDRPYRRERDQGVRRIHDGAIEIRPIHLRCQRQREAEQQTRSMYVRFVPHKPFLEFADYRPTEPQRGLLHGLANAPAQVQ
jgi:hypothetical protein